MFSQRVQWKPLLLVISIFTCKNTHSVALGLVVNGLVVFWQLGIHTVLQLYTILIG